MHQVFVNVTTTKYIKFHEANKTCNFICGLKQDSFKQNTIKLRKKKKLK